MTPYQQGDFPLPGDKLPVSLGPMETKEITLTLERMG